MEVRPGFRELLALLNEHKVERLIVGGYALAFYGAPGFTGDADIEALGETWLAEQTNAGIAQSGSL